MLLLAAFSSVAAAKPKVAILGIEAVISGALDPKDAENARKLTEELRAIPRAGIGKYDLAPNSNRELQDEKLMGNCDNEKAACMAPIGTGLSTDFLIFGNITKTTEKGKEGYKADLKILNVTKKMFEEGTESVTFVPLTVFSGGSALKEWAQAAYARLTKDKSLIPSKPDPGPGPAAGPGKLVVNGNVQSGDVFVGGVKKGRLAGGTITLTLPEGSHALAIDAPGHKRYEGTVTVKGGQTSTVRATLDEVLAGTPPVTGGGGGGGGKSSRTPWKLTGYGLAGLGLASGAYVAYLTFIDGTIGDYEGGKKGTPVQLNNTTMMNEPITGADSQNCSNTALREYRPMLLDNDPNRGANLAFDKACTANKQRFIAGAVGIASGVLAVGALYFAYRSDGNRTEKSVMGKRKRRELTVTPVIGTSGGGATVRFDW